MAMITQQSANISSLPPRFARPPQSWAPWTAWWMTRAIYVFQSIEQENYFLIPKISTVFGLIIIHKYVDYIPHSLTVKNDLFFCFCFFIVCPFGLSRIHSGRSICIKWLRWWERKMMRRETHTVHAFLYNFISFIQFSSLNFFSLLLFPLRTISSNDKYIVWSI